MLLGSWEWPRGQCAEPEGEAREGRQWQAGSLLVWLELLAFPFQAPEESSHTCYTVVITARAPWEPTHGKPLPPRMASPSRNAWHLESTTLLILAGVTPLVPSQGTSKL